MIAKLIDLVPPLAGPIFRDCWRTAASISRTLVRDDEALAEHIRQNVAGTFHPVGTCRMSADPSDKHAVMDTEGRVRGFEGLRVIDASIMPTVPRGNTNIPTTMVAEKISAAMNGGSSPSSASGAAESCSRGGWIRSRTGRPERQAYRPALWPTVFRYCSVSSSETTSAYLALRSNRL